MTESKSTRDYIKNWGRVAARKHTTQTFKIYNTGLHIGKVTVSKCSRWSENPSDFKWVSELIYCSLITPNHPTGYKTHVVCTSEVDAVDAVHKMYYDMMQSVTFGDWVYVMCKRHEMTCTGFAERLGVTRQTVHYWVKGKRQCGDMYIYNQIAALFADLEQMSHRDMLGHMSLLFKRKN